MQNRGEGGNLVVGKEGGGIEYFLSVPFDTFTFSPSKTYTHIGIHRGNDLLGTEK